ACGWRDLVWRSCGFDACGWCDLVWCSCGFDACGGDPGCGDACGWRDLVWRSCGLDACGGDSGCGDACGWCDLGRSTGGFARTDRRDTTERRGGLIPSPRWSGRRPRRRSGQCGVAVCWAGVNRPSAATEWVDRTVFLVRRDRCPGGAQANCLGPVVWGHLEDDDGQELRFACRCR
ncbi:hypothetical protein, partial [Azospirillum griseum]